MDEAHTLLRRLEERAQWEYVSWEHLAYAYAGIGDWNALLRVLKRVPKMGTISRLFLALDPAFDPLHSDPRFQTVLPTGLPVRQGTGGGT